MPEIVLGILLVVAIVALVIAVSAMRRERERQSRQLARMRREYERQSRAILRLMDGMNASVRQVNQLSDAMENRQERLRQSLDTRMDQMLRQNNRNLEQVRQEVSDKLEVKLHENFQTVSTQLAGVNRGLGEMRELTSGVTDLRRMLGGVKTRGVWGEVQLKGLMSEIFAPGQYAENAAIPEGTQQRVEFALRLPMEEGGERLLPIDAKFPQEDYLRLVEAREAGDAEAAKRCAAQLERAVLEQARRIHDKYIRPPQTVDFAVMSPPTESLYAEVARLNGLVERTQERFRVLISGPATFYALVTSVQLGFRSIHLERRSGEVMRQLAAMKQDFARFDESIQRMRQRLNQVGNELDTLEGRAKKAVRAIERVDGA